MKIKFGIAVGLSAIIQCAFGFGTTSSVEKQVQSPKEDKMVNKSESSPVVKDTQESGKSVGEDFIIGSGDVLNIFVWKELEVSRSVPVRPDGKISLPLVNDVQASGLTALQLKDSLTEKLKQFIADPTVTVTVETVNSQKVMVLGEVGAKGARPLTGPTRIMDVLAGAGFTAFAKTSKIYVLRDDNGKQLRFNFNYKDYVKGKNLEQNILLKNGDSIVVP